MNNIYYKDKFVKNVYVRNRVVNLSMKVKILKKYCLFKGNGLTLNKGINKNSNYILKKQKFMRKEEINDKRYYANNIRKLWYQLDKAYQQMQQVQYLYAIYGAKNVIIQIKKFDEVETSNENQQSTEVKQETESTKKSSDNNILTYGMRPEFKKAMDSYESFMNEYCEFMKKYEKSDGTDMSLWSDYASYMSKYYDMMRDFEAWDDGEMNTAETAYYLDVQTRVNKKLLEVSQ